jgi:microcystin-dependent protein
MSCTNCYTGCVEITPDKCVRYTGANSVPLGIETGDTLLAVEQALIEKVVSFLDGTGINITIAPSDYCALVTAYLPVGRVPNADELFTALVKAACNLQAQITGINATLTTLNADYTISCLTGVTASSDTHAIVQAVINKLCLTSIELSALALDVSTNYVKLADLNTLIAAYLGSLTPGAVQFKDRMVPFSVIEYYGPVSNFDSTGKGLSTYGFTDIYLCNGNNGTPDKRGRVGVGVIDGVGGGALAPSVNPANAGNPNYRISDTGGVNTVTLTTAQIPAHTHPSVASATSFVNDPGHTHFAGNSPEGWDSAGNIGIVNRTPQNVQTTSSKTGITVATTVTVTNGNAGDGGSHTNIQPVLACYYIQYRPS